MVQLIHGGDIYSYAEKYQGSLPLDFSANINPLGMPECIKKAIQDAIPQCERYPDPLCRQLRQAIGMAEHVSPDYIFCGNGAAEIIFRFASVLQPRKVLLTAPTFAEYEQSLLPTNCEFSFYLLQEQNAFCVTDEILEKITEDLDAVYLCNPNNPTGKTIPQPLLLQILQKCAQYHIYCIVDECFYDFLLDAQMHTLKTYLTAYPNLILLRAFTKMYAIPGVRLGYCMTSAVDLIEKLYQTGQPWNVSVIAQACGIAAAQSSAFAKETAAFVAQERQHLSEALRSRQFTVYKSEVNFLLFHTTDTMLHQKLEQKGVLIRNCANYRGLSAGFYRTAVRSRKEQLQFLQALDAIQRD